MSDCIGRKIVVTRKPHVCFGCGREFPPRTHMERSCVVDGSAWTCYLCHSCQTASQELDWDDEYGFSELRERALEIEANERE